MSSAGGPARAQHPFGSYAEIGFRVAAEKGLSGESVAMRESHGGPAWSFHDGLLVKWRAPWLEPFLPAGFVLDHPESRATQNTKD